MRHFVPRGTLVAPFVLPGYFLELMNEVEGDLDVDETVEGEAESAEARAESNSLVPDRPLSPRHRRLAELVAQGVRTQEIAKTLGYTEARVSVLKRQPKIAEEIARVSDRIYEDTIKNRLKSLATPALDHVAQVLSDRTGRVKVSEKNDMAKFIIEKVDGKAAQVHDVGENLLGVMMDRLDALKAAGKGLPSPIDVTPRLTAASSDSECIEVTIEERVPEPPKEKTDEDHLNEWLVNNPLA